MLRSMEDKMCGGRWEGREIACRILAAKPENRPSGRPKRRWENNIEMNLAEIGLMWTGFNQLRMQSAV
jgi:hypothetical protein